MAPSGFSAYGLPAAGVAAAQGVDAAGLANKLAIAYQEAEQRKRRNDLEQAGILLNAGATDEAGKLLGAQGLQDPLARNIFSHVAQANLGPPKTLQDYIIRAIDPSMRQVPSMQDVQNAVRGGAGGAPPAAPAAQPTGMEPSAPTTSMAQIQRTPPAAGDMQGPSQGGLQKAIDILTEKRSTPREREMERLLNIPEANRTPDESEALKQYLMGDPKEPGSALDRLALEYARGRGGEAGRQAFEALIASKQASPEKLDLLLKNIELAQARIGYMQEQIRGAAEKRPAEIAHLQATTTQAKAGAEKAQAETDEIKRKADVQLQNNLEDVKKLFNTEFRAAYNEDLKNAAKQRAFTSIREVFQKRIQDEKDPATRDQLTQRMNRELTPFRPSLGNKPSLGF